MAYRSGAPAKRLTAIDLFSGCGGLTQGLKNAGFDVIGAVELDSSIVETYKLNHADVHVWNRDIQKLNAEEILQQLHLKPGELDLLAGCPPCQGFSSMRTLNGKKIVEDGRKDLIYDVLKLIKGLKPKTVMVENVPALRNDDRMADFKNQLQEMGYKFDMDSPRVLNVKEYGVPQRRRRMIFLASLQGVIPFAQPDLTLKTVREAISGLKSHKASGDPLHDFPEKRTPDILRKIALVPKDGGSRSSWGDHEQLECHKRMAGFKDVYGRMKWDAPSPTITGGCVNPSKGRFLHPEENRAITLREAALLQSFPIDYKFSLQGGKHKIALMIGNALPPEFIRRQALQIKEHLLQAV